MFKWLQANQLDCEYKSRVSWYEVAEPFCTCRSNEMVRIVEKMLLLLLLLHTPYAKFDGMVRVRFSLRHMPWSPWSHPGMTCPTPTVELLSKVLPSFTIEENFLRVSGRGWPRSKLDWYYKQKFCTASSGSSSEYICHTYLESNLFPFAKRLPVYKNFPN